MIASTTHRQPGSELWRHPRLGLVRQTALSLPADPDAQVEATVGVMGRYVVEDARSLPVMQDAQIVAGMAGSDRVEVCRRAWEYVKRRVRFLSDQSIMPGTVEVLIRPVDMSRMHQTGGQRVGDCDDFTMWLAAILTCLGVRCCICTAAAESGHSQFSHVYVVAYPAAADGSSVRVPLDASHGPAPGWECPATRRQEWRLDGTPEQGAWVWD